MGSEQATKSVVMTKARVILVLALLLSLLVVHAICVKTKTEFWPISHYPMYSALHRNQWTDEFLIGVSDNAPDEKVAVSYFVFDRPISVKASLDRMTRDMEADPANEAVLRSTMRGLGQIYQTSRGGHRPADYRDIDTLKLIRVTWRAIDGEEMSAQEIKRETIIQVRLNPEATASARGETR